MQNNHAISKDYFQFFNDKVRKYFPSSNNWNPVDRAIFAPDDLYRIPIEEAYKMQFAAIKFSFTHHYYNNKFYHAFCQQKGVTPEDIQTSEDLTKIPLIPDTFFKDYPEGKDFATWLGNLYTGELPQIVIKQKHPDLEQVVDAFNASGLVVTYSSGTKGRHTFIPRDLRTFYTSQYALAKCTLAMSSGRKYYNSEAFLLAPNPAKNSIFVGKSSQILFDIVGTVQVAIDQRLSLSHVGLAMGDRGGVRGKIARYALVQKKNQIVAKVIDWLHKREQSDEYTLMSGPPYLIYSILQKLKQEGTTFNFGERGGIATGGGWKIHENRRLSSADFRTEVREVLGIPEKYCIDAYGMVESNGWMIQCPEGHYFHIPYSYFKPLILDESMRMIGPGKWGRFAFLDAAALSYPGFIITGDQARLLERCPACDRPGPVLEPEIRRVAGQGVRGCAEELKSIFSFDNHA